MKGDRFLGVDDEVLNSLLHGLERPTEQPLGPLRLGIAIGSVVLSVPEICRVREGDVLQIELFGVSSVVISLEGAPLFRGELVLYDGKISVRVSNAQLETPID